MADEQPTSTTEHWKTIPGWEGYYEASDHGRIRSVDRIVQRKGRDMHLRGKVIKLTPDHHRHLYLNLNRAGETVRGSVHRLVMLTFIGPCPEGMEVCHNNGDPADNRVENLRYDTHANNMLDKNDHGTMYQRHRTRCPRGHDLVRPNLVSWHEKIGIRVCLACGRTHGYLQHREKTDEIFKKISDAYYADIMRGVS